MCNLSQLIGIFYSKTVYFPHCIGLQQNAQTCVNRGLQKLLKFFHFTTKEIHNLLRFSTCAG